VNPPLTKKPNDPLGKPAGFPKQTGIDSEVLREFYRREQLAIPITIASLRLP
jgi:hypothetical protein